MGTVGKVLAGIVVVVVVAVAGLAIYVLTIDPSTLIAPVQAKVKEATGRDLAVRGGAKIALSLHPRVVLTDVALSNAPWATTKEMVKAQRVELAVALLPLLSRRFELEEIALVRPEVALETDGKGQRNWAPVASKVPTGGAAAGGSGDLVAAVAIGNVVVTDGIVTYRDGPAASATRVAIDKLAVSPRALGTSVAVEFRGTLADVPVSLSGTVGALSLLMQRRWPYPIDVKGEVAGRKTALSTRITAQDNRYALEELKAAFGGNALTGSFAVTAGEPRPKLTFDLAAPALALNALPVPAAPAATAKGEAKRGSGGRNYVIPDTPISFAPLRWADAEGKLAVDKLTLPSGRQYDKLRVTLTLVDGRLDVSELSAGLLGGTMSGRVVIDASKDDAAAITLRADGKALDLGAILAAAGHPREVRGGKTTVAASLAMRGASPHQWASTATGSFQAVTGQATLVNTKLELGSVWDKVGGAVNPFRERDPSTELVCAVVRLPLSNGVARVDRSIAMETGKVGVTVSGTLDFRNETLDFAFQPKARQGIPIDVGSLADLVRVSGSFSDPRFSVDVASSAKLVASIGAAVSTGGLSAVAQGLLSWSEGQGPGPCQIALGAATSQGKGQTQPKSASPLPLPLPGDVGKALGKLFGR